MGRRQQAQGPDCPRSKARGSQIIREYACAARQVFEAAYGPRFGDIVKAENDEGEAKVGPAWVSEQSHKQGKGRGLVHHKPAGVRPLPRPSQDPLAEGQAGYGEGQGGSPEGQGRRGESNETATPRTPAMTASIAAVTVPE